MKHGTTPLRERFYGDIVGWSAGDSRLRVTISVVRRQVSLLGGSEFTVTQQPKDLVKRGDVAFDAGDAFLGDNATANVAHPCDRRTHRVVGPDHRRDAGFA